jgi:hypothetical protein
VYPKGPALTKGLRAIPGGALVSNASAEEVPSRNASVTSISNMQTLQTRRVFKCRTGSGLDEFKLACGRLAPTLARKFVFDM